MKKYFPPLFMIFCGALIICGPAFYNAFPLVYSDTGTYIVSGFTGEVPIDRPITYGLFIRHASMYFSFWFTIYTQCILVASVLFIFLKNLLGEERKFPFYYLFIISILIAFTGLGWYSGQLMPDIFAPLLFLSLASIFQQRTTTLEICWLSLVFFFSMAVHFSHLAMGIVIFFTLTLFIIVGLFRKRNFILPVKKSILVILLVCGSFTYLLILNYTHNGGLKLSRGSHVFFMSHLIETGIMKEYLHEYCDSPELKECKTCNYKDSLETNWRSFLWSSTSTLYKTGGWEKNEEEYNHIFKKMFSHPSYLIKNIYVSFRFGVSQLFMNDFGEELSSYGPGMPPYETINKYLNKEIGPYNIAKQNSDVGLASEIKTATQYQNILLLFSGIVLLYYLLGNPEKDITYFCILFLIACIFLNSFVTAGLNIPYARLQSRVAWLFPLTALIIIIKKRKLMATKLSTYLYENNLHRP